MRWFALVAWMAVACNGGGPADDTSDTDVVDEDGDGDGFTEAQGDCNDRDDLIYPGAADTPYDGIDADCAEDSDYDADGDGYDSDLYGGTDCDDADGDIHPDADDAPYDGIDADCAEDSDYDADGDGYDSDAYSGTDCHDDDALAFPGAAERCNGQDDDCDTFTDEEDAIDQPTWYRDGDDDTYGDPDVALVQCEQPVDYVDNADDCDDGNGDAYPGATPIACDGAENDCEFTTREAPVVKLDGSPVATIAAALASATTDSVIEVCEGLHLEDSLLIDAQLTLTGLGPPEFTILDAGGVARLLRVNDHDVAISNLTLTGGVGEVYDSRVVGGGVLGVDGANLTLTDVVITGNTAGDGAGIYIGVGGTLDLLRVEIHDNHGDDDDTPVPGGGGVHADDDAVLTMQDTEIHGNTAGTGGGLELWPGASLDGSGSTLIYDNDASLNGGGIRALTLASAEPTDISGVTVLSNVAIAGGGIYGDELVLTSSVVSLNLGTINGGGIYAIGDVQLTAVTMNGNQADFNGGALYLTSDVNAELTSCTLTNNDADFASWGGGVRIDGGTLTSTGSDWGTGSDGNTPFDIEFEDAELTVDIDGVSTFTCTDTVGATCP